MIRLLFSYKEGLMRVIDDPAGSYSAEADCDVRNADNGRRALGNQKEVVYAMTENRYDKYPYMPDTFPLGVYTVNPPIPKDVSDKYLYPWFVPTTASRSVNVWALDSDGGYDYRTDKIVRDYGYGFHYSSSKTTLGCIRLLYETDIIRIVRTIQYEHKYERTVLLEVVA